MAAKSATLHPVVCKAVLSEAETNLAHLRDLLSVLSDSFEEIQQAAESDSPDILRIAKVAERGGNLGCLVSALLERADDSLRSCEGAILTMVA